VICFLTWLFFNVCFHILVPVLLVQEHFDFPCLDSLNFFGLEWVFQWLRIQFRDAIQINIKFKFSGGFVSRNLIDLATAVSLVFDWSCLQFCQSEILAHDAIECIWFTLWIVVLRASSIYTVWLKFNCSLSFFLRDSFQSLFFIS